MCVLTPLCAPWVPSGPELASLQVAPQLTTAQLHGRACFVCGEAGGPLTWVGHVHTESADGGRLGWPVTGCVQHRGEL